MKTEFTKHGWVDFEYWIETNPETVLKIKNLLRSIRENPFKGLGKPDEKYTQYFVCFKLPAMKKIKWR